MSKNALRVAVVGYPNCGKSVLFNALTGLKQRVGNWPGVTVDKKTGHLSIQGTNFELIDLPGIHSLRTHDPNGAIDARISAEYLLQAKPDLILNVIDASQLNQQLYLSSQLLTLNIPMVLALNMMDVAKQQGMHIDTEALSQKMQIAVTTLTASRKRGLASLKKALIKAAQSPQTRSFSLPYDKPLSDYRQALSDFLGQHTSLDIHPQLLTDALIEGDAFAKAYCQKRHIDWQQVKAKSSLEDPELAMADTRYTWVHACVTQAVTKNIKKTSHFSQRVDALVLHRYFGLPIFLLVMYTLFVFAINVSGIFQDFFDLLSDGIFVKLSAQWLNHWHIPAWGIALISGGLGRGINTTVTFVPVIGAMFVGLSFLEDSGYMARAAGLVDRLMRTIGLSGQAFVPMIVGFGCNVPAVMGARTLSNPRDRILSVMMMPFMSCGARLAIFAVFVAAFFPSNGHNIIFILYLIGIAMAILTALLLGKTLLPAPLEPLVMELPNYHLPQPMTMLRQSLYRMKVFIVRAGKNILWVCLALGLLNTLTPSGHLVTNNQGAKHSILAYMGRSMTPVFYPMGLDNDNWPATVGLLTGILAKEVVVGTLNTLYSVNTDDQLGDNQNSFQSIWHESVLSIKNNAKSFFAALKNPILASEANHDQLSSSAYGHMHQHFHHQSSVIAYLLFILLYFPCISTMAAMRRELGLGWASFSMCWSTWVAYSVAVIFYQLSQWATHPWKSGSWVFSLVTSMALIIGLLRYHGRRER